MWNMFAFVKVLPKPTLAGMRKMMPVLIIAAVGVAAFLLGRSVGVASQAQRPSRETPADPLMAAAHNPAGDGVVAYLKGTIPITRQELGEYLIARLGKERIEAMVNRKIIELACRDRNIEVSDAEVQAQIDDDLRALGTGTKVSEQEFVTTFLKRFNKTLYEWREDVIRPRLMMTKLVRAEVTVEPDDIQKAYETRYGPKVECRMIVLSKDYADWAKVLERVSHSEPEFVKAAADKQIQFLDALREKGGKVPAIHKYFGDRNIEQAAFALREGEVSGAIQMPDYTKVIMKCDRHIKGYEGTPPLDNALRMSLYQEVLLHKIGQQIPLKMKQLRDWYAPKIFLTNERTPTGAGAAQLAQQSTPIEKWADIPASDLPPHHALNNTEPPVPPTAPSTTVPTVVPVEKVDLAKPPAEVSTPEANANGWETKGPQSLGATLPQLPGMPLQPAAGPSTYPLGLGGNPQQSTPSVLQQLIPVPPPPGADTEKR